MNAHCPFEKAILSARCGCELSERFSVAEQMGVECRSDIARSNCAILLALMRDRARFALKIARPTDSLPFGKEMKVMIGGLIGLQRLMTQEGAARVHDIHALVRQAQAAYGSLETLPYQEIVKSIVVFENKRRGSVRPSR